MQANSENAFRDVERELDRMLAEAASTLASREIKVTDRSNRAHFKGEPLAFVVYFEARRPYRGPEIATVTATLTYYEPFGDEAEPTVHVESRAEIFQPCMESRFQTVSDKRLTLVDLRNVGLARLICMLIDDGYTAIGAVGRMPE